MCPTRPSKDIPVIHGVPDIPGIPVIHDIPASRGNSTSSSISKESTQFQHSSISRHSPIRMHILQFNWFPQKLHRVPVECYKHFYKHYILQRKGDVVIWVMSEMSKILPICQYAIILYLSKMSETLPRCQDDIFSLTSCQVS